MSILMAPVKDGKFVETDTQNSLKKPTSSDNNGMDKDAFLQLLVAQMQYQDPDNPMDTSELMATMVQSKMITALAQMTSTNVITYATSMLGKDVTLAEVDALGRGTGEYTKATITGVSLAGDSPTLYVGDKAYSMSQIMSVGEVKLKDEVEDDKTEGGDTEGGDTEGGDTEGGGETSGGEAV